MSKPESNGRQRCGRCHKDLTPGAFSPSRRGKVGKWCRACFKVHWAEKGAKKSKRPKVTKRVKVKEVHAAA